MKKIIIILTILFTSISMMLNAQDLSSHLEFKGIPITGTSENFKKKLKEKGFDNTNTLYHDAFEGRFASHDCIVTFDTTPKTKTVYMVMVAFETGESWVSIKNLYIELKNQYTQKYGSPTRCVEKFNYPFEEHDGHEITAIRTDKCSYMTQYTVDNGMIVLIIGNFKFVGKGYLCVAYQDGSNTSVMEEEKAQIISDDI